MDEQNDKDNPYNYRPLDQNASGPTPAWTLAGRGKRFGALLIDAIVWTLPFVAWAVNSNETLGFVLAGVIATVQVHQLLTRSQTLGKRAVGIAVADAETGGRVDTFRLLFLRVVVNTALGLIPFYGLVDALFIFSDKRQCVHDLLSKTIVIDEKAD